MREEKPTNYILDASFMLAFLLPDEYIKEVEIIFQKYKVGEINFISPHLLPFEVVNGLKYALRSKRIDLKTATNLISDFLIYQFIFQRVEMEEVLKLSLDQNLTVYDASYLYLAKTLSAPLLTLDNDLKKKSSKAV